MNTEATVQAIPAHGCAGLQTPYFIAVYIRLQGAPILYLPAVVDDFGDLVVVGRPM